VVKSAVSRAVLSRQAVISDAEDLFRYCKDNLDIEGSNVECCHNKRVFYYVDKKDIPRQRPERTTVQTLKGTRDLHSIRSAETGIVSTRLLSCYCACVTPGKLGSETICESIQYVDNWKTHIMIQIKSGPVREQIKSTSENRNEFSRVTRQQNIEMSMNPMSEYFNQSIASVANFSLIDMIDEGLSTDVLIYQYLT